MMRRILISLGVVLLLLAGAGFWLTHLDWEKYRPELAAQISDALGADVKLNGKLSVTFFPYPKLSAEDAEMTASGLHIQAPHLRLTAQLWPLLRGRVIISRADIEEPKIALTPQLWQAPRAAQDNMSRTKVKLEDVEIQNGEIDIALGQSHEVMSEIDAKLRAPDWHGPYQANADFIWHDQEWQFDAQLGIKTAAGTRPANFTLKQTDGPHEFSWRGAAQPVPLAMQGDGEWHSNADNLMLESEVNFSNQVIEIAHGMLSAGNKPLGPVAGHFAVGANIWQDLNAKLDPISPGALAGLSIIHLDSIWHKFSPAGALQFHLQGGALSNLQFTAPEISAVFNHQHWHLWGRNAADALALWGHPDARAWPAAVRQNFDVRLAENKNGTQIESLKLGKLQTHGALANQQLELQVENMNWPSADGMDAWRNLLRGLNLQKFTLHARQWDLAPLSSGDSEMVLVMGGGGDHLALQTPQLKIAGVFHDDDFTGQMACDDNHLLRVFHAACGAAKISGDSDKWQFTGIPDEDGKLQTKWHGIVDFANAAWDLHLPFAHGEVSADGKLSQSDYHMTVANLDLAEFLQIFLPTAPKGEGEISGQLHVTADKADGDMTANNLQLSGLNLLLDNPAQPGKIASLTAKVNWQGDVLELQQLHTAGPDGNGHASVNLDSAAWHGDWSEPRAASRVAIDGDADSASAQRYRFTETPRP